MPFDGNGRIVAIPSQRRGGLVYSTESGRMCPACRQPIAQCTCRAPALAPAGDGVVRITRETRSGKGVTVVRGVPLDAVALAKFAKELRTACGTGGTVKEGAIELQGDHRERVAQALTERGWRFKLSGG